MSAEPLQMVEEDQAAFELLRRRWCLPPRGQNDLEALEKIVRRWARVPYENLSKLLVGQEAPCKRRPAQVIRDHLAQGAGGTCFSLSAALCSLLRWYGWEAQVLLADRHYGPDTHSALCVWVQGRPYLVDPGFMINRPVPLDANEPLHLSLPQGKLILRPQASQRLELLTPGNQGLQSRLCYKTRPADEGEFYRAWEASFDWDMMRYPLLCRQTPDQLLYLRGNYFQCRSAQGTVRRQLSKEEVPRVIARHFGLRDQLIEKALHLWTQTEGGIRGRTL